MYQSVYILADVHHYVSVLQVYTRKSIRYDRVISLLYS